VIGAGVGGSRLLDPARLPRATVVLVGDVAPGSLSHLHILVPRGGLTPTDARRCGALVGRDLPVPPAEPADLPVTIVRPGATPLNQGADAGRALADRKGGHVYLGGGDHARVRQLVVGILRGAYPVAPDATAVDVTIVVPSPSAAAAAREGAAIGHWVMRTRDWANEPANSKTPQWLADQAAALSGPDLDVSVWDAALLAERGFGGLTAVGTGSSRPPCLIEMNYRPAEADRSPLVVLVGKGITFDSGGLSLKPAAGMPLMKTDMTGAAAVLGCLASLRDLGLPVRVTALVACAENMPSGAAMRPGDVVRHYGGRTTEVLNTDAEGRLVLADCLAYAAERWEPDYLVDLASLTGAATLGLGRQHAALYSDDVRLSRALQRAAAASGDAVWQMPLVADYAGAIDSDVADAANTNTDSSVSAGSITAALFLRPFAGVSRWAHLDIAGAARAEADSADSRKGATGFGVSLLTYWLAALAGRRW
jgi:leucyl aminopeptidase